MRISLQLVLPGLTLLLGYASALRNLDYSDLEATGVICSTRDSCSGSEPRNFSLANCECDNQCHTYNDCCINARQRSSRARNGAMGHICLPYDGYTGVYVISRCHRSWRGPPVVRQRCENFHNISDPLLVAPTTDTENDVTYKNRYCAECNNIDALNLQSWDIGLTCKTLAEANSTYENITSAYVKNNLSYRQNNPHRNKWGIYYWNDDVSREEFYPCELVFRPSTLPTADHRLCRANLVSTCPSTWDREPVRRMCASYMAVVYTENEVYRNPHCALCNGEGLDSLKCAKDVLSRGKPPMSFTLLLDVNMRDGNRVGEIRDSRCSNGQKWDPFSKRCRNLVCALPGYKIENGRCVPG